MATYTFTTARDVVASRTFMADTTKLGYELNAAIQWAYTRVFNSARGPDMIAAFADEDTQAARTLTLSLATATGASTLLGIKKLWLKLPSETNFTEMIPADATDPRFAVGDQYPAGDTTTVATGHPVYYQLFNNQSVRFSPPLPAASVVRTDYFNFIGLGALTGVSDLIHNAIIDMATATVFSILDDERFVYWNGKAERDLNEAIHALNRVQTGPVRTQPYRRSRRS